MGMNAKWKAD